MLTINHLLLLAHCYCRYRNISEARLSTLVFNHGARLRNLKRGSDMTVRSFNSALEWFITNWPTDLEWPDDVPRQ